MAEADELQLRAEWDAAYINDLPDSAFAVILPGGEKDGEGKTTPRDLRKLPHHNAAGEVDMAHLRNGLSREPQSDMPAAMHEQAHAHLQAHMQAETRSTPEDELHTVEVESELQVRDAAKREILVRVVPWDVVAEGREGPEVFMRGAFEHINPRDVVLRMDHLNPPAGRGIDKEDRADGQYMAFKVSKTQRGDEILTLAEDGVTRGVSPGYFDVPGGTVIENRNGRRTRVVHKAGLKEVSTTWLPTWASSEVLAVRTAEGDPVPDVTPAEPTPEPTPPVIQPGVDWEPIAKAFDRLGDRLERLEERSRQQVDIPSKTLEKAPLHKGHWLKTVLGLMTGDYQLAGLHQRDLADLITTDNAGVVPDTYSTEMIGIIDPARPFLNSTRRMPTPDTGMSLILPKLVTRPTVGIQSTEKAQLTSTATSITSATYDAVTKGGAGDISLQLLKRSSPSYLSLYLELLAEAYAVDADDEAVTALLNEATVNEGGALDPEATAFGAAWENAVAVSRRLAPDTIWLSSASVAAFIDAKASGTNAPLYSNLEANFTAGGGAGGSISGLRPVHVPALDNEAVDMIVGPSRGFAWAEDGTFTLQVDVPAKAGRDVALVGILWFAPLYPAAFTSYTLAS